MEIGYGTTPRLTYGLNLAAAWNGFDFSMYLQGVGNHQVYYNNQAFRFVTVMGQSLNKDITDNSWTKDNPYDSKYPLLRTKAFSGRFFVENLKIYASIENLFTITSFPGMDPEVNAGVGYPSVRQYSVGLNITF